MWLVTRLTLFAASPKLLLFSQFLREWHHPSLLIIHTEMRLHFTHSMQTVLLSSSCSYSHDVSPITSNRDTYQRHNFKLLLKLSTPHDRLPSASHNTALSSGCMLNDNLTLTIQNCVVVTWHAGIGRGYHSGLALLNYGGSSLNCCRRRFFERLGVSAWLARPLCMLTLLTHDQYLTDASHI